jgi:hypothetical protein
MFDNHKKFITERLINKIKQNILMLTKQLYQFIFWIKFAF